MMTNGAKGKTIIRDMTEADIPAVVELDLKVSGLKSPVSYSGVIDSYVGGELGLSCVAEVTGQIVGYVLGRLAYTPAPVKESAWIQLVGVNPEQRRRRIGRRLIDFFRQRCRARGVRTVHISVPVQDTAVQTFLQHCGFRQEEWVYFSSAVEQ